MAGEASVGVDQAGEKLERKWIKLVRNSRRQVEQARENPWIKLARNDMATQRLDECLRNSEPSARYRGDLPLRGG